MLPILLFYAGNYSGLAVKMPSYWKEAKSIDLDPQTAPTIECFTKYCNECLYA